MKVGGVIPLTVVLITFLTAGAPTPARGQGGGGRFALLVGSNLGDRGEPVLRHAEQDAVRVAQTLRLMGEFPADQVVLMTGATGPEMRDAIIRLNARLREQANGVLVVYYSGHADAQTLHLSGTRLPLAELKTLLVGSPAVSRLLIVDACRSGSLIQLKGAHPAPPFAVPGTGTAAGMPALAEPLPEGFAVLTSSAAAEDSRVGFASAVFLALGSMAGPPRRERRKCRARPGRRGGPCDDRYPGARRRRPPLPPGRATVAGAGALVRRTARGRAPQRHPELTLSPGPSDHRQHRGGGRDRRRASWRRRSGDRRRAPA